jgi:mono/diheme cytochrome c family protein
MNGPVSLWAIIGSTMAIGLSGPSFANPPAPATLEQGRAIYEQRCLDCHGPEGRGDGSKALSLSPRPGNLVSAHTSAKSDQEYLSEEEQQAVLDYIRSLVKFTRSATPPPPAP